MFLFEYLCVYFYSGEDGEESDGDNNVVEVAGVDSACTTEDEDDDDDSEVLESSEETDDEPSFHVLPATQ